MWQIAMMRTYSAVKIMTQAVSRQKNEILYLSPQANTWKFAIYNIGFYFEFEESERKNFNWPHFYQGSLHRAPFQPRWPSPRRQWRSQSRSKTPFEWFFAILYLFFWFFFFIVLIWSCEYQGGGWRVRVLKSAPHALSQCFQDNVLWRYKHFNICPLEI